MASFSAFPFPPPPTLLSLMSSPDLHASLPQTTQDPNETHHLLSPSSFPGKVANVFKSNLVFRSKWGEINGSMGDLGTYIPIVLALTLSKDLNLGTTLIFTGIYNIITGVVYGVPMPVQPMKSIAAVSLSTADFGIPEMMGAGILTGGTMILVGITGLMELVYRLIPLPVVRGIQLAQGLSFAITAVKYIRYEQNMAKSKSLGYREWLGLDGLVLALFCACFVVIVNGAGEEDHGEESDAVGGGRFRRLTARLRKFLYSLPSAFIIFLLGLVLAFIRKPSMVKDVTFGPSSIDVVKISKHAWKYGFIKGTIPQLPLSILNSVIAVCKLSADLFPGREFSATSLSVTVGLMNVIGCWFGAFPTCHGAGGLAGQYKFGGRSGGCVALLGAAKMTLGLVLGSSLAVILRNFPVGILGVLLLFAGVELAMASRDMNSKEQSFVVLICTAVSLMGSSAALGFVAGMAAHVVLWGREPGKLRKGLEILGV